MNELHMCFNTYMGLWSKSVWSAEQRDIIFETWRRRYLEYNYQAMMDTLYWIDEHAETKQEPTTKQIMTVYKSLSKENSGYRIETPEEVLCNLFHEEMRKPHDKRDYWLLDHIKWAVPLFEGEGWEERYKAHFGKYRKEFESL